VYPNPQVAELVSRELVPVRVHIKEQPAVFERFGAQWTPTIIIQDPDGTERHRIEGFLPVDDFSAQLELGLAHAAFAGKKFSDAEKRYRGVVETYGTSDAAPEAQYWAGVSNYKGTNNPAALKATADAFKQRFKDSAWAKKASVWG
jgi:hypothetical protein